MTLMKYEPWAAADRLQREFDRLFSCSVPAARSTGWTPRVDIQEDEDRFVLRADLPGVDPKEVEITAEDGVLTLSGERAGTSEDKTGGYRRVERIVGKFSRRFSLPDTVDAEAITATSNFGVLELVLPKREAAKPRRITINAG